MNVWDWLAVLLVWAMLVWDNRHHIKEDRWHDDEVDYASLELRVDG